MDLRSQTTIMRKKEEVRVARERGVADRLEAELKRTEAKKKQLEEERCDMKSTKAQNHSNKLRYDREISLIQIGKYQNQIDFYKTKMTDCEK